MSTEAHWLVFLLCGAFGFVMTRGFLRKARHRA